MLILFEKLWYVKWCHLYLIGIKRVECSAKLREKKRADNEKSQKQRYFKCSWYQLQYYVNQFLFSWLQTETLLLPRKIEAILRKRETKVSTLCIARGKIEWQHILVT